MIRMVRLSRFPFGGQGQVVGEDYAVLTRQETLIFSME